MHTRGVSKRLAKDQETEEGREEQETAEQQDTEMEQQAGDKEAVSYTHLDVYKRQVMMMIKCMI